MLDWTRLGCFILLCGVLSSFLTACDDEEGNELPPTDWSKVADHTVLMYLNGDDNSLSNSIEVNARDAQTAIRDSVAAGTVNLVIFKDNRKNGDDLPTLYWVHRNGKTSEDAFGKKVNLLDTVPLLTFNTECDIMNKEMMTRVLKATFTRFDTKMKGMIFGGHALGWIPSTNYVAQRSSVKRMPTYVGYDSDTETGHGAGSMEIWEMREAFEEAGITLDYLLFDACNMGCAECAYELRNVAHYMVAAPTEIEGAGFPYKNVITHMEGITTDEALLDALDYDMHCYYDANKSRYGAVISMFDLTKMEDLAQLCVRILNDDTITMRLAEVEQYNYTELMQWQSQFQRYGRQAVNSSYYFYDLYDAISWISPEDEESLHYMMMYIIESCYFTETYHDLDIEYCHGMAVSLPWTFRLQRLGATGFGQTYDNLISAYKQTQWGKLMLGI